MSQTENGTYFLFTNQTVDANSSPVIITYPNKTAIVKVWGTWGGASIKFQTLAPRSDPAVWIDVPDVNGSTLSFTSNKQSVVKYIVQNEQFRAVQSGSTGTTTLNATLEIY